MSAIDWLKLPERAGVTDLDAPSTTLLHAEIVQRKAFLKRIYADFYGRFRKALPAELDGLTLIELGSGGGFLKEIIPSVITSDVMELPNVDARFSAMDMPLDDQSVDALLLFDVFHHLPDARRFLREADRCLKVNGKIVMIEPAYTAWSRIFYTRLPTETVDPDGGWGFADQCRPLSDANPALPWIVFCRDRDRFEREFPSVAIRKIEHHTPLRYLASGGLSMRQVVPTFMYGPIVVLERLLAPAARWLGMFMTVELLKRG